MRKSFSIVAVPVMLLFAGPALAQSMCVVAGNRPIMGANMNAAFEVQAGQGCMSDISPQGSLSSSEISQRPQNGSLNMVDKDTWTYTPAPGYSGTDSVSITATGQSIDQKPGTSVLSYRVTVK